jgi:glycosyltransferase involved in cell wall biosynthesis
LAWHHLFFSQFKVQAQPLQQFERESAGGMPGRKPVLATMPGPDPLWNTYVEDCLPANAGSIKDLFAMLKLAKGRKILILNGSVGRRQRYRDLLLAILLKLSTRHPPPVLMQDATWEPGSEALSTEFPFLKKLLPRLARLAISAIDGPHMRYAVLSTKEVETFPQVWGVDPHRVVFQPFPNTLHKYRDMPTRDDGYLFAGGNSVRDYGVLEAALEGTGVPTRIATKWQPTRGLANLQVRPTSHDEFMSLMANSHAVVVPLRQAVRSAGQQTYLNAMGLGKPVIVVDAPGVRDYVIDGVTGVVVAPDVQALRAAILHVMDPANAGFYSAMGKRAREDVLTRFTEERFRHGLLLHAGMISQEEFEKRNGTPRASGGLPLEPPQFQQAD